MSNPCWKVRPSPERQPKSKWLHRDIISHWRGYVVTDLDLKQQGYRPVKDNPGFYWAIIDISRYDSGTIVNPNSPPPPMYNVDDIDDVIRMLPPVLMENGRYFIGDHYAKSTGRGDALHAIRELIRVCGEHSQGLYGIPSAENSRLIFDRLVSKGE